MGRLIQLELENFKSYGGQQIIGPFDNFTSIIGPNGAGKSNLMDAISFVLGVRSQHLRSVNLRELIHRKSLTDPAQNARGAYVEALIDHSGREYRLRRTISERAAGGEYSIDGRHVKWQEYDALLQSMNILVKAKNFLVFQGYIEQIAAQTPKDLTKLIEQISGSEEYRDEYEQLKSELEKASEESAFNFNKKKGLAAEFKQYKLQKDEAERYEKLCTEKDDLIIKQMKCKLFQNSQETQKAREDFAALEQQEQELRQKQKSGEEDWRAMKKEVAGRQKDVVKLEKQVAEGEKEVEHLRLDRKRVQEEIKQAEVRAEREAEAKKRRDADEKSKRKELSELQQQLKKVERAAEKYDKEVAAKRQESAVQLTDTQRDDYDRLRRDVDAEVSEERRQLVDGKRRLYELRASEVKEQQQMQMLDGEWEMLKEERRLLQERHQKLHQQLKQAEEWRAGREKRLQSDEQMRRRLQQKVRELEERIGEAARQLSEAKFERRESERRRRQRETVDALKQQWPVAVHGQVHSLCKPRQPKFALAVQTVLGRWMDGGVVVVEDRQTAVDCIKYLKDRQLGRMTFVALDAVGGRSHVADDESDEDEYAMENGDKDQGRSEQQQQQEVEEGCHVAVDCLTFDQRLYRRLFEFLCGGTRTLICDTVQVAQRFLRRNSRRNSGKLVCLDGTVMHKSGCITAGASSSDSSSGGGADTWQRADWDRLGRLREDLERQLLECQQQLQSSSAIGGGVVEGVEPESLRTRLSECQQRLQATEKLLADADEKRKKLKNSALKSTLDQIQELQAQLNDWDRQIEEAERRRFSHWCKLIGVSNVREYEQASGLGGSAEVEADDKQRLQFHRQIARLQSSIEFLEDSIKELSAATASGKKGSKNKQQQQIPADELLNKLSTDLEMCQKLLQDSEEKFQKLKQGLQEAQKDHQRLSTECQQFRHRLLAESQQTMDGCRRQMAATQALIDKLAAERQSLRQRCELEQIPVVVDEIGGEGDEDPMEEDANGDLVEFDQRIEEIVAELQRMAPNLKAADHLVDVDKRLHGIQQQFDETRRQAKQFKDRFNMVQKKRHMRFMAAFQHCQQSIDRIYKQLTASRLHPLGGTAYLTLENADEPFLAGIKFHAMPPMKRFRDMDQLSGGERTIAALALLFAIQSFKSHQHHDSSSSETTATSSSFFVLDEIDAALDNSNIAKIANYITHNSSAASASGLQFIVISLKNNFYEKSQSLIGIYRDPESRCSKTLSLSLDKYENNGGGQQYSSVK